VILSPRRHCRKKKAIALSQHNGFFKRLMAKGPVDLLRPRLAALSAAADRRLEPTRFHAPGGVSRIQKKILRIFFPANRPTSHFRAPDGKRSGGPFATAFSRAVRGCGP